MPDGYDPEAKESHVVRVRAMLRNVVMESTPKSLWLGLQARARLIYPESYDANKSDHRLVQEQIGFKTIQDRHFFMDGVLRDCGKDNGCSPFPSMVRINRWSYTQIDCGLFHATQKYVPGPGDMPKPAEFRKALAAAGRLRRQEDFWRPSLVQSEETCRYNAVVIHKPLSYSHYHPDFRENGYVGLAFPYDDYLDWAAKFSLDEVISWYDSKGMGASPLPGPSDGSHPGEIGPTPTWKVPPKKKE